MDIGLAFMLDLTPNALGAMLVVLAMLVVAPITQWRLSSRLSPEAHLELKQREKVLNIEIPLSAIMADINYGMDVLLEKYQLTPKESKLAQKYKKQIFSKSLHKTKVNELLLYMCKSKVFKNLVIASNSSRENVDRIMSYHQIDPTLFDYIYTREDVSRH